ncbi:hypothetical protein AAFF_G00120650 [Aldrovandia affinis]|uniref:Uncharacterized protein n=1 Tax=Aldrovandia affinis TaxID=143900 RepID=A0AAD7RS74_9TELE|nr:hypothetical protein AAFF_G00120650 [Aldrovandia affinis]
MSRAQIKVSREKDSAIDSKLQPHSLALQRHRYCGLSCTAGNPRWRVRSVHQGAGDTGTEDKRTLALWRSGAGDVEVGALEAGRVGHRAAFLACLIGVTAYRRLSESPGVDPISQGGAP